MRNNTRNPSWPDWYNGKKIDEVQFGRAFLEQRPLKCVNGTLYTLDGPIEDESEVKQQILENIEEYVTSGLSKKVTNILETIKLLAFSEPFPIEQDCIHLQNGVYHLADGTFQETRLFCQNRLPVKYDPKAASPERWLTFLHDLLDDADIPTLQEYLGYCLIPSTKGQKMMLIVGKGGEGKSRIGLVLKRLMGDAASNGSVQKVENNRFARADLERRLLMIDDDMDMNALPKTNYISCEKTLSQAVRCGTNTGAASSAFVRTKPCKQCLCLYKALLPCKNLLGSIPNPLTVQHPPGAALQL